MKTNPDAIKRHPLYGVWMCMKDRCRRPNNKAFPAYGGRGIRVCDRWRHDFLNFVQDMGPRPTKAHTLERINNDGNYEPGNCRWATRKEQLNNTRINHFVEFLGQKLSLAQWAEILKLDRTTLLGRLRRGWPIEKAVTLHADKGRRLV
jgi:hypothetical protein